MPITLILAETVVKALREEARSPQYTAVAEAVHRFGGSISQMHPGEPDPALSRFFWVEIPDPSRAESAASALTVLEGVEAAYVKPRDALP